VFSEPGGQQLSSTNGIDRLQKKSLGSLKVAGAVFRLDGIKSEGNVQLTLCANQLAIGIGLHGR